MVTLNAFLGKYYAHDRSKDHYVILRLCENVLDINFVAKHSRYATIVRAMFRLIFVLPSNISSMRGELGGVDKMINQCLKRIHSESRSIVLIRNLRIKL